MAICGLILLTGADGRIVYQAAAILGALFLSEQQSEMCGTPRQAVCELVDSFSA